MIITSIEKCLLRTKFEEAFAFTRHIRQTLGVTEPRNTGLLQAAADRHLQAPGCTAPFGTARCATLHCRATRRRNCPAGKNKPKCLEP